MRIRNPAHLYKTWIFLKGLLCTKKLVSGSKLNEMSCYTEAEFLEVLGQKPEFFSLLFTSTNGPSPSLNKSGLELELVCNVNIVYGNLKSENSRDYAQIPQRNCTFINSASVAGSTLWIRSRFSVNKLLLFVEKGSIQISITISLSTFFFISLASRPDYVEKAGTGRS